MGLLLFEWLIWSEKDNNLFSPIKIVKRGIFLQILNDIFHCVASKNQIISVYAHHSNATIFHQDNRIRGKNISELDKWSGILTLIDIFFVMFPLKQWCAKAKLIWKNWPDVILKNWFPFCVKKWWDASFTFLFFQKQMKILFCWIRLQLCRWWTLIVYFEQSGDDVSSILIFFFLILQIPLFYIT